MVGIRILFYIIVSAGPEARDGEESVVPEGYILLKAGNLGQWQSAV